MFGLLYTVLLKLMICQAALNLKRRLYTLVKTSLCYAVRVRMTLGTLDEAQAFI